MAEENEAIKEKEETTQASTEPETKERGSSENLRVLENIEVKLTVEVGSTEIKMRDLLRLNEGSVVELDRLAGDPLDILAWQFDIVCNGVELSSGAIRNHKPDIMLKAFEIAGYEESEIKKQFGSMYEAFKFGAPPHGGSAPGIDRIVMLLANEKNIREVTLFPMNQNAQDLMMKAPSEVETKQLKELGIKTDIKKN